MTPPAPKVTLHMVSSLDGYISSKDGSLDWLDSHDHYEKGVEGEDSEEFLQSVDCFVMGSRTYEQTLSLGWPYGDVPVIVLTTRKLPANRDTVAFYSGDLQNLLETRLRPRYQNIWVVGGSMVVREFLRLGMADEIRLSIVPIILGEGAGLFIDHLDRQQPLHLKDCVGYRNGLVELCYEIKKH